MMETNTVSPAKANTRLTSLEKKWVMYDVGNSAWVLFAATLCASARKVNPILLIVLSAVAGIAIYA